MGHDYRADLAAVVAAAFAPEGIEHVERVESVLVNRERQRDAMLAAAEQAAQPSSADVENTDGSGI